MLRTASFGFLVPIYLTFQTNVEAECALVKPGLIIRYEVNGVSKITFCFNNPGSKIAPIFYNTMEDSGALPLEMPVDSLSTGDVIDIFPYEGVTKRHGTDEVVCKWSLKTEVLLDEVRAGGRIPLIIGKGLTARSRASLGLAPTTVFRIPSANVPENVKGYTLAQKMVGRACGLPEGKGVLPGIYCEPGDARTVTSHLVYLITSLFYSHGNCGFSRYYWTDDER